MAFYVGPFQRIVNFHLAPGEPVITNFFLISGVSGDGFRRGAGAGIDVPDTDPLVPGAVNLLYRNPADPAWVASCGTLVTIHNGVSSPEMQMAWTGFFEDTRAGGGEDPNDMPWLDGLVLTVEGYGELPALGAASAFTGLFRQTYDGFRTTYAWVNFPDTGAIPPFPISGPFNTEDEGPEQFQITYPDWEDYFNPPTG